MNQPAFFKQCSTCKTSLPFGGKYYKCGVSTCNKKATALYFCSVPCWDAHVPDARHRDAWAEEEVAPSREEYELLAAANPVSDSATRRVVSQRSTAQADDASEAPDAASEQDVLVVMSKIKGYIKTRAELRTSDGVADPLSAHLRHICRKAIQSAAANDRSTVLARDIEAAISGTTASE